MVGPAVAEESGEADDEFEWQETHRNADEIARLKTRERLKADTRKILLMKLSWMTQIQGGQGWGRGNSHRWSGDCTVLAAAGAIAIWHDVESSQ